ncbi:hypothetical protein P9112_004406 [Eukaryota sp. TZLM1-RC]
MSRNRTLTTSFESMNRTVAGVAGVIHGSIMKSHDEHQLTTHRTPPPFQIFDSHKSNLSPPSFSNVYIFIYDVFRRAQVEPECIISAFIYLERLRQKRPDIYLTPLNWEKLLFTSIMVSSKFADDISCSSYSFSLCSEKLVSLHELNQLEALFVTELDFELYVGEELYRDVYYTLKKLWVHLRTNSVGEVIPLPKSTIDSLNLPGHFGPYFLFKCHSSSEVPEAAGIGSLSSPRSFSSVLTAFKERRRSRFGRRGLSI